MCCKLLYLQQLSRHLFLLISHNLNFQLKKKKTRSFYSCHTDCEGDVCGIVQWRKNGLVNIYEVKTLFLSDDYHNFRKKKII